MLNLTVKDLINKSFEDHDSALGEAIKNNPEYTEAEKRYEKLLERLKELDKQIWLDLDSEANLLEALAVDTAFNEGFKLAIKLILSSIQ
jgi:predicted nuclease with TOPRIM domain